MKKLIWLIIMTLILATGCSSNTLEDYQEALVKTDGIERGKSQTEMELSMTFDTEGLDQETVEELGSFENIAYESAMSFDFTEGNRKVSSMNLLSLGGLGINFDYHMDGDQAAVYIPMLGKYLSLSKGFEEELINDNEDFEALSNIRLEEETLDALDQLWRSTFEADEVVKGEKSTMETLEGDVRVVKFTVTPDKDKLKTFTADAVQIILADESIKEMIEKSSDESNFSLDFDAEAFTKNLQESMGAWDITEFSVEDFIDVDGYIVESRVAVGLEIPSTEQGGMRTFQMSLVSRNYEIEKEQSFDFPKLTEENSITIDSLEKGLPSTYENLLN